MKDKRIWIIFLIIFANMLGFGIVLPLLPYYVESFGAGPFTIGLLAASFSLFQFLSAPILGELSDKIGRRPVLLFSIGGTALSFLLMGLANTLPLLFLARIIDGASGGNISTAQAYIADITTRENRTQGMGIFMAAISLGFILGPAIGGFLSVYGYSVPAFVGAFIALIATVFTFFFLPETQKMKQTSGLNFKKKKMIFSFRDFYDALTHKEIGSLLTISFVMMFGFSLLQGTFALFSEHSLHLTAKDNGFVFAYLGIVGFLIQIFFLKRILKLFSEHKLISITIFLMALSFAIIAFANNLIVLFLAITILSFSNNIFGPVVSGLISKKTPDSEQGNVMGLNQSIGSVARIIGPILGAFLYSYLGMKAPYIIVSGILIITFLICLRSKNYNL